MEGWNQCIEGQSVFRPFRNSRPFLQVQQRRLGTRRLLWQSLLSISEPLQTDPVLGNPRLRGRGLPGLLDRRVLVCLHGLVAAVSWALWVCAGLCD